MYKIEPFTIKTTPLFQSNKKLENHKPLLSVLIITYNHENFIKGCLDGILMQICDFKVEVIVANDCSPDNTNEIINEILNESNENPFIKYLNREHNWGAMQNFIDAYKNCNGKYIAFCEGDDYWTDENKLQKQVDFLEKNTDFNLVGHYVKSSKGDDLGKFTKDIFEFKDIYQKNLRIPTASIVSRNNFEIPNWFSNVYGGDRAIIFLNAQKGKLKVLPFFGSFYRLHEGGSEHNLKRDKFNFAIRNIKEEFIYYKLLKNKLDVSTIKKRILKNHYYMVALGIKKIEPLKSLKSIKSLVCFYFYDKIKF
ncbi:glycosyltransferase family 2 protein [Flavobacterium luteum]|uniref:Glycosyltransferase n=1 Tax=Flavobacterium luteum TaxID=2026654 RepID=A0A7J5AE48_9FLAO|nr:glycosyltransferase family 2 protein [Flavobacterium luteum]KAB1155820.1 glycosyltransferase [Flavobacterium luteum]